MKDDRIRDWNDEQERVELEFITLSAFNQTTK